MQAKSTGGKKKGARGQFRGARKPLSTHSAKPDPRQKVSADGRFTKRLTRHDKIRSQKNENEGVLTFQKRRKKKSGAGVEEKKRNSREDHYTYVRTLAESSTGAKGGSFKKRHNLSPGKKKIILKKRRGEIKFQKKQGKIGFDLKRLTLKSFDEAGLPEVKSPVEKFTDIALDSKILSNLSKNSLAEPTPIQGHTIPVILEGRDVIGIANTGTGKTAAFVLPTLQKILKKPSERVLIVAPTRELAEQIAREVQRFSVGMDIRSVVCIGGRFLDEQARKLSRAPQYVIGTPGRLLDLERRKKIRFSDFNTVVLDEMDRMLDMGFSKDIKHILLATPKERQTLLFSATMPKLIQELARQFLTNPLEFTIKPRATSKNVEQSMVKLKHGEDKIERLHEMLLDREFYKVIIFGRTKRNVDTIVRQLITRGFSADAIHGDKTQSARSRALKRFTRDEVTILVATDVAARGLDIPDVTHVINYDIPETYDDYVHRIGRTGRGDKSGKAFTFVTPAELG